MSRKPTPHPPWTPSDLATLRSDYATLGPIAVATALGRSTDAVRIKARKLGIRPPAPGTVEGSGIATRESTRSRVIAAARLDMGRHGCVSWRRVGVAVGLSPEIVKGYLRDAGLGRLVRGGIVPDEGDGGMVGGDATSNATTARPRVKLTGSGRSIMEAATGLVWRSRAAKEGSPGRRLADALDWAARLGDKATLPERMMAIAWQSATISGVIPSDFALARRFGITVRAVAGHVEDLSEDGLWPVVRKRSGCVTASGRAVDVASSGQSAGSPTIRVVPVMPVGCEARRWAAWKLACMRERAEGEPELPSPSDIDKAAADVRRDRPAAKPGPEGGGSGGGESGGYSGGRGISIRMLKSMGSGVIVRRGKPGARWSCDGGPVL